MAIILTLVAVPLGIVLGRLDAAIGVLWVVAVMLLPVRDAG
jgi:hypothetical protein